jgi:uncharacterized protein (TIGR03905 family)
MLYKTRGVCASHIQYEVDAKGNIHNVKFMGGCPGNGKAVAALIEGMPTDEAVKRLRGIDCGGRGTSCADQLATALTE